MNRQDQPRPTKGIRVLFINRYFHPDLSATSQLLTQLAIGLAMKEFDIRVITSRQLYEAPETRLPATDAAGGVSVTRVWTTRFGRTSLVGRAADYLTFYISVMVALWRLARAGDIVVAKTDPPLLAVALWPIVRLRRARLVNWLQDIFPEVGHELGMGRGAMMRLPFAVLASLRDRTLRTAAANVVLGTRMAETIIARGAPAEKVTIIHNWADPDLIEPIPHAQNALRHAWGLDQTFTVAYSGNLGLAHDYMTFLGAMERLALLAASSGENSQRAKTVQFLFVGGGNGMRELKALCLRKKLMNVRFEPYQAPQSLAQSLSAADVHLISLRPELEGLIVPSKFYGIAAAGRSSIFVGDANGELGTLLTTERCGTVVPQGDVNRLADAILSLAADSDEVRRQGTSARGLFERRFTRKQAQVAWAALLERVAAEPAPRS